MLTEKELLILAMRAKGLRQTEIAEQLHITQGAVSRFERNAKKKILEAKAHLAILERMNVATDEPVGVEERAKQLKDRLRRNGK